jgi:hypothetical protein
MIFFPIDHQVHGRVCAMGAYHGPKDFYSSKPHMERKISSQVLDTPTTLRGGVNECGALFPKTSLLHKNSSISIQHLFITHCFHL